MACLFILHVEIPVPGGTKQRELVPCLAANDDEVALKLAVISESLGRPKRSPASLRQAFLPNAIFFLAFIYVSTYILCSPVLLCIMTIDFLFSLQV